MQANQKLNKLILNKLLDDDMIYEDVEDVVIERIDKMVNNKKLFICINTDYPKSNRLIYATDKEDAVKKYIYGDLYDGILVMKFFEVGEVKRTFCKVCRECFSHCTNDHAFFAKHVRDHPIELIYEMMSRERGKHIYPITNFIIDKNDYFF